jgi:2-isopropylmalate synthase
MFWIPRDLDILPGFTTNVEFSPMDATRTDWDYLCDIVEAAIASGATTVNIPDTVGYIIPDEFGSMIAYLFKKVKNINGSSKSRP